ncbi:hypothetical protein CSOJ01_15074 [Colletotrichum sojae]|uniref:Uncharacterized protein n=1 Tax=Colletotrichum sojae TaxID=2175907 RepID=A0A8H6IND9_9PEZI|nr:hypothetical protein CSOJ01_15074 [Colletotrichum sojae]
MVPSEHANLPAAFRGFGYLPQYVAHDDSSLDPAWAALPWMLISTSNARRLSACGDHSRFQPPTSLSQSVSFTARHGLSVGHTVERGVLD